MGHSPYGKINPTVLDRLIPESIREFGGWYGSRYSEVLDIGYSRYGDRRSDPRIG